MKAWLNGKSTENLALAGPGDWVYLAGEGALLLATKLRTGIHYCDPLDQEVGGYAYAGALPNLCCSARRSETCATDPRFLGLRIGYCVLRPCPSHQSRYLPSPDCTVIS